MPSRHHGNRRYCLHTFWQKEKNIFLQSEENVSGAEVILKENNVQMPQQRSPAVQVEAGSTLLPIYSTNMGCSAFTECLLLGELAPSC